MEKTLASDFKPQADLARRERASRASRTAVFKVQPRVLIDNRASAEHTVIELNARDRAGLLFDVARALAALRLSVSGARIATYGESAIDVFYVKDSFGMKATDSRRQAEIRAALLAAAPAAG